MIALAAKHDYAAFVAAGVAAPPGPRLSAVSADGPPHHPQQRSGKGGNGGTNARRQLPHGDGQSAARRRPLRRRCQRWGRLKAPVFKLKGYYRFHFQVHSPSAATLHQLLRLVLPAVRLPAGVEICAGCGSIADVVRFKMSARAGRCGASLVDNAVPTLLELSIIRRRTHSTSCLPR